MTTKPFLKSVSDHIIGNYIDIIGEICIVLPNRRAGLFLKNHLSSAVQKTIWEPAIYSIEDFVIELSGMKTIDPVFLLFELYEVHREVEKEKSQSFDQFMKWGNVLLHDFNDVDMYLADAEQIFGFVSDAKAVEKWNPDGEPLTDFELKYLRFFSSLKLYYTRLKKRLILKNQVYQGLAYRKLAEDVDKGTSFIDYEKIIFAGFNALTATEEKIVKTLVRDGKADILWDADSYYFDNEFQEAGLFLRRQKESFSPTEFKWKGNDFRSGKKRIEIIGVPQNVGQAKVAADILSEFSDDEKAINQTALVLNDESLMLPVLNSIPDNISRFNLTMGLPLVQSPLFSLYEVFFNLHENGRKFDNSGGRNIRYYFRDLLNIVEHIHLRSFFSTSTENNRENEIAGKLRDQNKVFYDQSELNALFSQFVSIENRGFVELFIFWDDDPNKAIENLILITDYLKTSEIKNNNSGNGIDELKIEYLFHFSKVFKRLQNLLTDFSFLENVHSLHLLFLQIVKTITIPFYGEPLNGLQIMGMLESRTLDFKNLIMLSVNEDLIPSGKAANSFIPVDIRILNKLPTYKDRNAIFAYHFYRLLQRSQNISLIYNTEVGEFGGGDKSRFISQLLVEMPKYNSDIEIIEKILTGIPEKNEKDIPIVIEKNNSIFQKLIDHAALGFSPSALNIFRNCSLKFYFQYVAGLKETEDVEETIEAATLGNVIHDVLQKLFLSFVNRSVVASDLKKMVPLIKDLVRISFEKNYKGGDLKHGKNLLTVKVAEMFILNYLQSEMKMLNQEKEQLSILSLEELYSYELKIPSNLGDNIYTVMVKGKCDRIDNLSGTTRVVDYKSGNVQVSDLALKEWELLAEGVKQDKIFQVLFYAYVYSKNLSNKSKPIQAGIISLRNSSKGFMPVKTPDGGLVNENVLHEFECILIDLTTRLLDQKIPFTQTSDHDNCNYCPYSTICNR